MSQSNRHKPSKIERERAMHARMGMKHPKDQVLDFRLQHLKRWSPRVRPPTEVPDQPADVLESAE